MSKLFQSLSVTQEAVWLLLEAGAIEKGSPANLPVLAKSSAEQGPTARIVALRSVDRVAEKLTFFTHASSGKVRDLNEDERAELLVWDGSERLQIRLSVAVKINKIGTETWSSLGPGTRLNYAVDPTPGMAIDRPEDALHASPQQRQMVELEATILRIETLRITRDGLRRAIFEGNTSRWIAP